MFSFMQVYFSANINSGIPNYKFSPAEKVLFGNVFSVMLCPKNSKIPCLLPKETS